MKTIVKISLPEDAITEAVCFKMNLEEMKVNFKNEDLNFDNINDLFELEKEFELKEDKIKVEKVEKERDVNIEIRKFEGYIQAGEKVKTARNSIENLKHNLGLWNILFERDLSDLKKNYDKRKLELERLKSGDQGQGKKKRETWTDQDKKNYIEEFIEFRDSKKGKSLEDIKSLWDKNIVSKSENRIPKASALKKWSEDGKFTMTNIEKENIPDLRIFVKE